ncbi:PAS domain-containing protein [Methylobacterium sp. M6A4_1b]
MGQFHASGPNVSPLRLQEAINASDVIGRWEYDVPNDLIYADPLVALVFNIDTEAAARGVSLGTFLAGVHRDDRERFVQEIKRSTETGLTCTFEYRVCSADGVVRWVLDHGRIALDHAGRPRHGQGVLIDITRSRLSDEGESLEFACQSMHPLERAAEHCLAANRALREVPDSLLHQLSDMLLLAVGRALRKLSNPQKHSEMK